MSRTTVIVFSSLCGFLLILAMLGVLLSSRLNERSDSNQSVISDKAEEKYAVAEPLSEEILRNGGAESFLEEHELPQTSTQEGEPITSEMSDDSIKGVKKTPPNTPIAKDDTKEVGNDTYTRLKAESELSLYRKACRNKDGLGCRQAGKLLLGEQGLPAKPKEACKFFTKGCRLGDGPSCVRAASLWLEKNDQSSLRRGIELLQSGCSLSPFHAESCFELGKALALGRGGVPDDLSANKALLKACHRGDHAEACFLLGTRILDGKGRECVPELGGMLCPPMGRLIWLRKACDFGVSQACQKI